VSVRRGRVERARAARRAFGSGRVTSPGIQHWDWLLADLVRFGRTDTVACSSRLFFARCRHGPRQLEDRGGSGEETRMVPSGVQVRQNLLGAPRPCTIHGMVARAP
jgi:hypothetical protein